VPLADVSRFESEFLDYLRRNASDVLSSIRETKQLSDDIEQRLVSVIEEFKKQFTTSDGSSVVVNEAKAEAMNPDDEGKESVKVNRPAPAKK
jgi:F-type H+/Na+-transporting ATPase subunit alpha